MKVLSAIGRFFARIGRWIKETAWIQPLLIVGAIFAVIFAIPHIIDGFKGLFSESDAQNKYFGKHQISLVNADVYSDGKSVGNSKVDELFTWLENGDDESINNVTKKYGEQFFLAFVEKSDSCKDLYDGVKKFEDLWAKKNAEFSDLTGSFKLHTIYMDSISKVDNETNLFDTVWANHYNLFETLSNSNFLPQTFYAKNKNFTTATYVKEFVAEESTKCPISAPLMMYFNFSKNSDGSYVNWTEGNGNQLVKGLSDVLFSIEGSSDLEKAYTLRRCWNHLEEFASLTEK